MKHAREEDEDDLLDRAVDSSEVLRVRPQNSHVSPAHFQQKRQKIKPDIALSVTRSSDASNRSPRHNYTLSLGIMPPEINCVSVLVKNRQFNPEAPPLPIAPTTTSPNVVDSPSQSLLARSPSLLQVFPKSSSPVCDNPFASGGSCEDIPVPRAMHESNYDGRFRSEFEHVHLLGKGSFGDVMLCRSRLDGAQYAIKIVHWQKDAQKKRLIKEVFALAALSHHKHIVRYFTSWVEASTSSLYLQLEYCKGGSLRHYLERGERLPETTCLTLLNHVAQGLSHLHSNGAVHLDVKPDNIYEAGHLFKLGDLGLCSRNEIDGGYEEGEARYLAKEMVEGTAGDLTKADIFSLGASVVELVRGTRLAPNGEYFHRLRLEPHSIVTSLSCTDQLKSLLVRMLSTNPHDRPSADELLTHPLVSQKTSLSRSVIRPLCLSTSTTTAEKAFNELTHSISTELLRTRLARKELQARVERKSDSTKFC